jgi:hypothetical protein
VRLTKIVLLVPFQSQTYHGVHVTWHLLLQLEEVELLHKQFTTRILMFSQVKLYHRSPIFLNKNNATSSAALAKPKKNKIVEVQLKLEILPLPVI